MNREKSWRLKNKTKQKSERAHKRNTDTCDCDSGRRDFMD